LLPDGTEFNYAFGK